ncbi:alpha-L-fucosidase [Marinilongibacter aquaticus]|uniref:alpha-L-fucosidase n=1 Tax=Marinilongibacter aquaticus TaxID=2975157 RepID=UPI0021BDC3D1|nr:alpha-L-fucosidase [Marinilongibacter aquaticus]UBM60600.1 alpha-L-fucosidase [Marinilongibacter aquaticus]
MKRISILLVFTLLCQFSYAQKKIWDETEQEKTERLAWWTEDRFGMFIHWGLYALPARHEWVKNYEKLNNEDYQKYFDHFNPDLYDPSEWAKQAKAAGMKYVVLTAKHHEGFCLFDSKYTDYKSTNTPYGKDLIREYVDALRKEGLKVGFYYSLIDWHHPDFTVDRVHPQRTDSDKWLGQLNKGRDMNKYREYLHNQVRELLTNYGKIDILWLDYSYPGKNGKGKDDWGSVELLKMVRQLQPGILVNNRADLMDYAGGWDFVTPEQFKVPAWPKIDGKKIPWETCQTFSGSWGYYRDENTWKSNRQLLVLLIESVSKGGNLLLNVGPTARGEFDYRAKERLADMGEWMHANGRSIYGCTEAPAGIEVPENCLLTYNPKTNRLYIHLLEYPLQNFLLKGMRDKIEYAQFLHDGSEVQIKKPHGYAFDFEMSENDVNLALPVIKPHVEIPVIEVFLK